MPAEHRNTVAALEVWIGRRQMPPGVDGGGKRLGQLIVVGAGLLKADHVGRRLLEPGQEAAILGGAFLDGGADAVDVDGGDDHEGQTLAEGAGPDSCGTGGITLVSAT